MPQLVKKGGSGSYSRSANVKLVEVARRMGYHDMSQMQATTRVIYDAVKLSTTSGPTTITLFEGCNSRTFPFTNLTENKLQKGEALAMQYYSLYIISCNTGTSNVTGALPLDYFSVYQKLYGGYWDFYIAQDNTVKKLPLTEQYAPMNKHARFQGGLTYTPFGGDQNTSLLGHQVGKFDNDIIILPQLEFKAVITIPTLPALQAGVDSYLALKVGGLGCVFSPKSTY